MRRISNAEMKKVDLAKSRSLLYLVTEELLMEAHEIEEKPVSTLVLFGGFLAFWSIQLLGR